MDIYHIASLIIALIFAFLGATWYTKFKVLVKEIKEAFETLDEALEDDTITKEELIKIVTEALDVFGKLVLRK